MSEGLFISVKVEGEEVGDLLGAVEVEESDSLADQLTLCFDDSHRVFSDVLHEGLTVEVDLGWRDAHALIFRGPITGIEGRFPSRGTPQVEVEGADRLIWLSLKPRTRSWWSTNVSQIVRDIARDHGLGHGQISGAEDAEIEQSRPLRQVEETDLAFLYRLAEAYDCKLFLEHDEAFDRLSFVSTRSLLEADPVEHDLVFQANLEEFSASFDAFATRPETSLVTTDPQTGRRVELSEDLVAPREGQWDPDARNIARLGAGAARIAALLRRAGGQRDQLRSFWRRPPRLAGAPARASSDRSRMLGDRSRRLGQTGRGRAAGSIYLRPRRRIRLVGYGGRWSGFWYLACVRHQLDVTRRSYVSSFVCTR